MWADAKTAKMCYFFEKDNLVRIIKDKMWPRECSDRATIILFSDVYMRCEAN